MHRSGDATVTDFLQAGQLSLQCTPGLKYVVAAVNMKLQQYIQVRTHAHTT